MSWTEYYLPRIDFDSTSIEIVYNVYQISKEDFPKEFVITFGNKQHGYACNKEDLIRLWYRCIRWSKYKSFGDVTLIHKTKGLIRAIHNAERKVTEKGIPYPYVCNKYNS